MDDRVTSLRKEQKEKMETLKENFEKRGLNYNLSEIKFTVKEGDHVLKKYEKMISAVKRKFSPHFEAGGLEQKKEMFEIASFGFQKIVFERIYLDDSKLHEHIIKLLFDCCGRIVGCKNPETVEQRMPVKITVETPRGQKIGFALLNGKLKNGYHNGDIGYKRDVGGFGRQRLFDAGTLLAESFVDNSIEQFARKNEELMKYLTVRHVADKTADKTFTPIPSQEEFARDVLELMDQYQIEKLPTKESTRYTDYMEVYYGFKDDQGYLKCAQKTTLKEIALDEILSQMEYVSERSRIELEERSEYAKAFQTKKHITHKVQRKMDDNAFLKRYGFVELDNEVDLERFEKLEAEFLRFIGAVNVPLANDHSFRIKKLGKHRAAGLYYPFFKATIFDLEHPDAYAHELGHQIDHTASSKRMLSEDPLFRPVIDAYRHAVLSAVAKTTKDDQFLKQWNSKNKYNKAYYFQNTEIFARCFEMYLNGKRIQNSFLQGQYDSPVYPADDVIQTKIRNYFDRLFAEDAPRKEEAKKEEAKKEEFYAVEADGQIAIVCAKLG